MRITSARNSNNVLQGNTLVENNTHSIECPKHINYTKIYNVSVSVCVCVCTIHRLYGFFCPYFAVAFCLARLLGRRAGMRLSLSRIYACMCVCISWSRVPLCYHIGMCENACISFHVFLPFGNVSSVTFFSSLTTAFPDEAPRSAWRSSACLIAQPYGSAAFPHCLQSPIGRFRIHANM